MTRNRLHSFSYSLAIFAIIFIVAGCSSSGGSSKVSGDRKEVVIQALSQIGAPYRYGGNTPESGFDCSGLVRYSHKNAGVNVPRSTLDQKKKSEKVSKKQLNPGDLVFFKTGRNRYHVGIMVDDNRFVHAPSSGKSVRKSSLSDPYWKKRYIGAGTYLN